eukprot:CAMPEP_0194047710 /NCGR_PEP_ID=MMETSP0009_2-20130614/25222_1 /TAXON_ID=210454 /ORGANISM="Grammatophora oceanica, Strain CCMP 410" /LENGTH=146 /DNA_ID=CAMNT_0038693395 /DNA_START=9 /DNA_END=449 /DNA_ORIENTATION=+
MAPVDRSAVAEATPETIWKTCFVPMKWESWDVDVDHLDNVSGECVEGTTFNFVMKEGGTVVPNTLMDVEENKTLTFLGVFAGGLMKNKGVITLTPEGTDKTKIDYSFELQGPLGWIFGKVKSQAVVSGTEEGLANIVKLSEAAQKE